MLNDLKTKYSSFLLIEDFECEDGWYKLIDETLSKIEKHRNKTGDYIVVKCIKEKLGSLRIYTTGDGLKIYQDVIGPAIDASTKICERCGSKAKIKKINDKFKCLCSKCERENAI